jgi:2,3-bisphosphoglycerate-independent phosphoglycerate mutase
MLVIVTSDHSTPSAGTLVHSGEPVPLTMHGCGVRRDRVECFDEVSAASGALGMVRGKEMMYLILNYLDRAKLVGIMYSPIDQPFWPGEYAWFSLKDEGHDE